FDDGQSNSRSKCGSSTPRCLAATKRNVEVIGIPDLSDICSASVRSCWARTSAAALPSASALAALASSTRRCSYWVSRGTASSVSIASPWKACGGAFCHILCQGRLDDGRAFKAMTLATSHSAIHQRSVEQLPGAADKVPTQPVQPTLVVQTAKK